MKKVTFHAWRQSYRHHRNMMKNASHELDDTQNKKYKINIRWFRKVRPYKGVVTSLARPPSRCILFDG